MMKKYHLTLIVLTIFVNSYAQKKLDNTIVVDTFRTINEIKQILFDRGFTIDGSDTSYFITTPKQMKTASVLRLMIGRTNATITIKGQAKMQVELVLWGTPIKNDFEPVEYRLSKQNMNYDWFMEMDKVASMLGSKRKYYKQ